MGKGGHSEEDIICSCHMHLLNTCYMPGIMLGTGVKWWAKQATLNLVANVFQIIPQINVSLQTVMRESQERVS